MRVPTTNRLLKFLRFQVNDLLQFPAMKAPLRADARRGYVLRAETRIAAIIADAADAPQLENGGMCPLIDAHQADASFPPPRRTPEMLSF